MEEKSRRSPEIIQYFTVSPTPQQKARRGGVRRVNACATVSRATCRDSWLHPRSCVGTWPSAWRCAASRTTPGKAWSQEVAPPHLCRVTVGALSPLLQPGHRLPAHLHVLHEQRELRRGADGPQEPAGVRSALSRSGLLCSNQFSFKRRVVTHLCPSDRTRRHPAAQGLHSGHLRTDRHQFHDRGVHEGPSHGSHLRSITVSVASNLLIPAVWLSAAADVGIFLIIW